MEHRWGQRTAVNIPVRLTCQTYGAGEGRITDISLSGARIQTELELPPLALVNVIVEPSDTVGSGWCHGPDTRLLACVVRCAVHELGVEWTRTPTTYSQAPALLRAAVRRNALSRAASAQPQPYSTLNDTGRTSRPVVI